MTPEEQADWTAWKERGDLAARDRLFNRHSPLVRYSMRGVKGLRRNTYLLDEVESEGMGCLLRCLGRFDPGRGIQFSTYAVRSLRYVYWTFLQRGGWKQRRYRAVDPELLQEIADHRGIDSETQDRLEGAAFDKRWLKKELLKLPPRTQSIVLLHLEGMIYREIGAKYGIGKERVRQILMGAFSRIRSGDYGNWKESLMGKGKKRRRHRKGVYSRRVARHEFAKFVAGGIVIECGPDRGETLISITAPDGQRVAFEQVEPPPRLDKSA